MWSSTTEIYPVYLSPSQAPIGTVVIVEPQVALVTDYRPVQPPKGPYELTEDFYARRLWIC